MRFAMLSWESLHSITVGGLGAHVTADKIHVVPKGISCHAFDGMVDSAEVKGRYGIAAMAPTVCSFGRMTRQKGFDMLVKAIPLVLGYYQDARFAISATGPERDAFIGLAHGLRVQSSCIFPETLPRPAFIDLIRASDIVAAPSRNELFGIAILEAWAASKPAVVNRAGGASQFAWHDADGFPVDANPGGLAHGLGPLLADPGHCRALGGNRRRAVENKYTGDTIAASTEGVDKYALDRCFAAVSVHDRWPRRPWQTLASGA